MIRTSSGIVPYRIIDNKLEFVLVTSTANPTHWVLPKGGVEPDLDLYENAQKECAEECGYVVGRPSIDDLVNTYTYFKRDKSRQRVYIFAMPVLSEADVWEEADFRERRWFTYEELHTASVAPPVREAVRNLKFLMEGFGLIEATLKRK